MTQELPDIIEAGDGDTERIVQSMIPYLQGSDAVAEAKAIYLSFRASGFTVREAAGLAHRTTKQVANWREADEEFRQLDSEKLPILRASVGREVVSLEFLRNYRLILMRDYQVLKKCIQHPDTMTSQENQYLLKARAHYTPQQLAILEQLFAPLGAPTEDGMPKTFTEFVMTLSRTQKLEIRAPMQEMES